ncbi:hypothetical protein I6Z00_002085 [Vibrio parahaemolyticus]|nr:hypothetical protein [Vibrio parahaemolyticus]EHK7404390.1 hypothetical protein [Vibrio parahaemolyticus]MDF4625028.1 hypothetical protein [Vibrio parahaemolyticus]
MAASTTCPKCGNPCELIFRRSKTTKDGKVIYPKKGSVFPIPVCNCGK